MLFLDMQILIGPGGRLGDILAAIWFVLLIMALFLIPRSTRIRVAERFGLGLRPRLGEPGLRPSRKVKILIRAFMVLLILLMLLYAKSHWTP